MAIEELKYQTDYLFNYEVLKKVNEIIGSIGGGYALEGDFVSTDNQSGSPEDIPVTVSYGATQNSLNNHLSYDGTTDVLTVNTEGFYSIKVRLRFGRTGQSGVSEIFNWVEISVDGGTTFNILGNAIDLSIDGSDDSRIFFDSSQVFLPAGVQLRSRFARSSTGADSGDLIASNPSVALQTYGLQGAPSAQLTIYKIP